MALLDLGLVGNGGQQKVLRDAVDGSVVVGEDQRPLTVVLSEQVGQDAQLPLGAEGQRARLAVGEHGGAAFL